MDLPQAVIFDFSGTLMRIEQPEPWVRRVLAQAGLDVDDAEIGYWARKVEAAGGHPGGASPKAVPMHLIQAWETRDLGPELHRAAYTGLIRESGWPWPDLIDALYDVRDVPEAWNPYPDAEATLRSLRERGVKTGLISNIARDIRRNLAAGGLLAHLDAVVLSFEAGVMKPDPAIWEIACAKLGVAPADTVMVGDHDDDRGGEALGIRTFTVEHLPADQRPHALADVLEQIYSAA